MLTATYEIDQNDILNYQLYHASMSKQIKKRRLISRILIPVLYGVIGLFFIVFSNYGLGIIFIVSGVLWLIFFPIWERKRYINHFKGFLKENYKSMFNDTSTIRFDDDSIFIKGLDSESTFGNNQLERIDEITDYIFVKLKSGQTVVLPKNKISNIDEVRSYLLELTGKLNLSYEANLNWKFV